MIRPLAAAALVFALLAPLAAQSRPDADINARIRQEENSHSQIMKTLHMLADVYGPRVTGSPSLKAAGEWAIAQMQSWGFSNGHLEPWDFGHPGWVNERFSAHITAPVLVLVGDEDEGCLEPALMLKRTIPTAGLTVLPRTGHTANLEEPDVFNRAVDSFLSSVARGSWHPRDPRSRSASTTGMA